MHRLTCQVSWSLLIAVGVMAQTPAQPHALTWRETQERFRSNNLTLLAGQVSIEESRAGEISAFLRPNPGITLGWDQLTPFNSNPYRPVSQSYLYWSIDYLHERQHKRELRLASARGATAIATSAQADLERNLMFNLRDAFVRVLQAKAIVAVAQDGLDYYDKVLAINRDRFNAGGIARVDLQRLELQRLQYLSDLQTAQVNLRTAKIDLLQLLQDRSPVDQFDVAGDFDFVEPSISPEDLRTEALNNRPDLKEAQQACDKAQTDHKLAVADGAADPTFGLTLPINRRRSTRMSVSVFPYLCASSTKTRARSSELRSTSATPKSCATPPKPLHCTTSTPPMPLWPALSIYSGPTKTNI